jgi:predicted RNA-binding Zn-ribbon protein involved in translation (DUF1610 family)
VKKQIDAACPKCGYEYGFRDSKPRYHSIRNFGSTSHDWLRWECTMCGYAVVTPTADDVRLDEPSPATRHRQQPAPGERRAD